ncbi:hypothetical protein ACVIGB_003818 [Bradyrhizobium sp. USDA 4341]
MLRAFRAVPVAHFNCQLAPNSGGRFNPPRLASREISERASRFVLRSFQVRKQHSVVICDDTLLVASIEKEAAHWVRLPNQAGA